MGFNYQLIIKLYLWRADRAVIDAHSYWYPQFPSEVSLFLAHLPPYPKGFKVDPRWLGELGAPGPQWGGLRGLDSALSFLGCYRPDPGRQVLSLALF